jgi:parvulin-like peptidyl-prolyl isomerase
MRRVAATLFCAAALGAAAGCGGGDDDDGGVPKDAVAKVGDTAITKSQFESARKVASDPSDPAGTKQRAMEAVIRAEWIRQEAEARHVTISDAEVQAAVAQGEKSGFLSKANLDKAGLTLDELMPTIRNGQLEIKVTKLLTEASTKVSDEDVADYYRRNKSKLIVGERRDIRLVLARMRDRAAAARAALDDGESWDVVARRYSIHPSRKDGGRVENVRKGAAQDGLLASIFQSRVGALVGPVKARNSWAVFVVEKIKPPFHASLEQARDEIKQLLSSRRRQQELAAFERKYRAETTCAPGYTVPSCKNGPKKSGTGA